MFKNTLPLLILITYFLTSCEGNYLLHQSECPQGKIREGSVCIEQSFTKSSEECLDPDINKIQSGVTLTLCDGSKAEGTLKLDPSLLSLTECKKDGEQNCIAKSNYKVVNTNTLDPSTIAIGITIAGVTGTKQQSKVCKNGANRNFFDITPLATTKKIPNRVSAAAANTITTAWSHGLATNDTIQLICSGAIGTTIAGGSVSVGTVYYANVLSATTFQFKPTPAGGALTVTGTGGCTGGEWIITSAADGIVQDIDTIDDRNNLGSVTSSPSQSPWSTDDLCNESNFTNVSGSAPFTPSNTIPPNANLTWSQIWKNNLTGMYFTNILYDTVPYTHDWHHLDSACKGLDLLNGGAGGSGWRLPTQKELMLLYIHGISKLSLAGGVNNQYFWTSTGVSYFLSLAWMIDISNGYTVNADRSHMGASAICIRS